MKWEFKGWPFIDISDSLVVQLTINVFQITCHYTTHAAHVNQLIWWEPFGDILLRLRCQMILKKPIQAQYSKTPIYRAPIYRVPLFTGPQFYPRKQALCVNQCKWHPDLPGLSIYRA